MGLIFNGNGDVIKAVDGSLTVEGIDLGGGTNVNAGIGTFSDLKVTGTLTYEDVKNVDSVGIISARQSIHVGYGVSAAGIITATSFRGDGSQLTSLPAQATIANNADNRVITGGSGVNLNGEANLTFNGTTLTTTQFNVSTGANAFETSANVFKGASGQKGVYLRSALSSATTPSYSSVDDTNTGIFLPGSDVFAVTTGGTEKLRITSAGKVGINTASPRAVLDVEGNATNALLMLHSNDANANLQFSDNTGGARILNYGGDLAFRTGTDAHVFGTGDSEHFRITSGGNLGIGESTPDKKLVVVGDVQLGATSPTNHARSLIFDANRGSAGDTICNINWQWNSKNVAQIRGACGSDTTNKDDGELRFYTSAANSLVEAIRITSARKFQPASGNLDIINPSGNVTIQSQATAGDSRLDLENTGDGNYSGIDFVRERQSGTGVVGGAIFMKSDTSTNNASLYIQCQSASAQSPVTSSLASGNGIRLLLASSSHFGVEVGDAERLRINSTGNIGINQATPASRFHISEAGSNTIQMQFTNATTGHSGGTDGMTFGYSSGGSTGFINVCETASFLIKTGGTAAGNERLRITSTGLVQIGPTHNASTYGWDARLKVAVEQSGNDPSAIHFGESANGSANPSLNFIRRDGSTLWSAYAGQIYYDTEKFVFATSANAAPGSHSFGTRMVIKHNGNIGIGDRTTSPDEKLHVHTGSGAVTIHAEGATHANLNLRSHSGDSTIKFSDAAATNIGNINYDHGSDKLSFRVNGSDRLEINNVGNLTNTGQETSYVTTTFSANFAKLDLRGTNIANGNHYILSYGEGHANDHEFHMVNTIGDLVFRTNAGSNTERLRIKSSGVVMAGMDNFSGNVTQALDIRGRYVNAEGDFARLMFRNSSDSGGSSASIRALRTGDNYGTNLTFWTQLHGGGSGGDGLERLRIETDGDMRLVNGDFNIGNSDTTGGNFIIFGKNGNSIPAIIEFHGKNSSGGGNPKAQIKGVNNTYAWASDLRFYTQDHNINLSEHFRIQYNGDLLATDTSIGSLSDSRLKTNITNYTYDLSKFKQFQPKTFDWKNPIQHGGKSGVRGFLAQDLESIDSSYVSSYLIEKTVTKGNDDGTTTTTTDNPDLEHLDADGIAKASKFGPKDAMYISVINQLISKIETLETKVAAL